jgi:hypothetical protein
MQPKELRMVRIVFQDGVTDRVDGPPPGVRFLILRRRQRPPSMAISSPEPGVVETHLDRGLKDLILEATHVDCNAGVFAQVFVEQGAPRQAIQRAALAALGDAVVELAVLEHLP